MGGLAGQMLQRVAFTPRGPIGRESLLAELKQRIRDVRQGPDGLLYLLTDANPGGILRIEPAVLVVEDESQHPRAGGAAPAARGDDVPAEAGDGHSGLELARAQAFDLVILDLMLPGLDGVTVCRAIRRDSPNADTPILMLTARREESDKVVGLDSGADDYLTKPFGIRELMARVRALLRRGHARQAPAPTSTRRSGPSPTSTSSSTRRGAACVSDGRDVELTFNEFELLYVLISNPGHRLQPRSAAQPRVEGRDVRHRAQRRHAGEAAAEEDREQTRRVRTSILTVWGAGYKAADV